VAYFVLGYIGAALSALMYNFIAQRSGGVELRFDTVTSKSETA